MVVWRGVGVSQLPLHVTSALHCQSTIMITIVNLKSVQLQLQGKGLGLA